MLSLNHCLTGLARPPPSCTTLTLCTHCTSPLYGPPFAATNLGATLISGLSSAESFQPATAPRHCNALAAGRPQIHANVFLAVDRYKVQTKPNGHHFPQQKPLPSCACNIEPADLLTLRLNLSMLHDMDANSCILRLQEPPLGRSQYPATWPTSLIPYIS